MPRASNLGSFIALLSCLMCLGKAHDFRWPDGRQLIVYWLCSEFCHRLRSAATSGTMLCFLTSVYTSAEAQKGDGKQQFRMAELAREETGGEDSNHKVRHRKIQRASRHLRCFNSSATRSETWLRDASLLSLLLG